MKNIFRKLNLREDSSQCEIKEAYFNLMEKCYDELDISNSVLHLAKKRIDIIDESFKMISCIKNLNYLESKYELLCYICEKYKEKKNYEKALFLSNEFIDFLPIISEGYLIKADILAEMKEHEEAIKYFEIAEEIENDIKTDQYIQYIKAQSQMEAKRYKDAIKTLKKIIQLYGDNPFFLFDIACCYEELGNENMYNYYCAKRDKYWKNHDND